MMKNSIKKIREAFSLKPFTKEDWYGYAGAENLPDGSPPLIGRISGAGGGEIDVIVSGSDRRNKYVHVEVNVFEDDDQYVYIAEFPSLKVAQSVLDSINLTSSDLSILENEYGFELISM